MKQISKILIVGKNPPPYFGTSMWFDTLQLCVWPEEFELHFFNNNSHTVIQSLDRFSMRRIWRTLSLYRKFSQTLKELKPDLVLIPVSQSSIGFLKDSYFVRSAKKNSQTLIVLHGSDWLNWLDNSSQFMRKFVQKTLKKTTGGIVLGEKLKPLLQEFYPSQRVFSVPNGIPNPALVESLTNKVPVISHLSNLQERKGIRELIEACGLLKPNTFVLHIIGDWHDEETKNDCLKRCKDLQLPVHFFGALYGEEKMRILNETDIFVFTPKQAEGHPLVILEAMSCTLPIVTSNQGALSETVIDQENGFVLNQTHAKDIASVLERLLTDEQLRVQFGKASRTRFLKHYTDASMCARYCAVFKQVLQENSPK